MVDRAVLLLNASPLGELAKEVLRFHFGGRNKPTKGVSANRLEEIRQTFELIRDGLAGQVVLCLSKDLGGRGETTRKMHLSLAILGDDDLAVARTIIHEASHYFAETKGTTTSKTTQSDDELDEDVDEEVYAHSAGYGSLTPKQASSCADSYAWAALSLHHGHLVLADDFRNDHGCQRCVR